MNSPASPLAHLNLQAAVRFSVHLTAKLLRKYFYRPVNDAEKNEWDDRAPTLFLWSRASFERLKHMDASPPLVLLKSTLLPVNTESILEFVEKFYTPL